MSKAPFTRDPLIQDILDRMVARSEEGCDTYGETMEQASKPFDKWIVDAQEEAWDLIVYLEKIRQDYLRAYNAAKEDASQNS